MGLDRGNQLAEWVFGVAEGELVRASVWRLSIAWLLAWTMGCVWAGETPTAGREVLRVAAASDLTFVMPEIHRRFSATNPGIGVETVFGSSGGLVAQIRQGAPFDLFLSADRQHVDALVASGMAVSNSITPYARGRLVVWSTRPAVSVGRGWEVLRDPDIRRLAIANPVHAPYGRAAREALQGAGLWTLWTNRLVLAENVAQAAQWVESGSVELGLVSRSWVMAPRLADVGRWWLVPAECHAPLEQTAVVTRHGALRSGSQRYLEHLRAAAVVEILGRFGFDVAEREGVRDR